MIGKSDNQIIVINAGGQYCHMIARRVREAGVHAKVCSPMGALASLNGAKGVIISGGPSSVYADNPPKFPPKLFTSKIPILGVCYGHQVLAHTLNGRVEPGVEHEYGAAILNIVGQDTILKGVVDKAPVWMSHGDEVVEAPPGFQILARTKTCKIAAMADLNRKFFGLQFHPEVTDTPCGGRILKNFIFDICGCEKDWHIDSLIDHLKDRIKSHVGDRHVLFFVSGGVDSTVAFALCTAALSPDRVTGVFVDTGFMRKNERIELEKVFTRRGWNNILYVDESEYFLNAIQCKSDPEEKRKIIGDCFLDVQHRVGIQLGLTTGKWILGQGTIYPDTIESGHSQEAAVIKTHHNRVPAIQDLIARGLIIEPLKDFYKDEVREIGRQLGLPKSLIEKYPFPGPGLAVRCLCSKENFSVEGQPKELQKIAKKRGLRAWKVPLRTVGVQGDHRSYSHLVILTGKSAKLETYSEVARTMTRKVRNTNRVAFLITPIEPDRLKNASVTNAYIDKRRLNLLREADAISHEMLFNEKGLSAEVWQFPVVLLPLTLGSGETIALRPVSSTDAMTARHADLPLDFIKRLGRRLKKLEGVDMVLYDVTDKPPATIEWE
jgi:GMP synthase (glutamine-hydrolysing)